MTKFFTSKLKKVLSRDDNIVFLKNVIGNYSVKLCAMIVSLLITPAYISYFFDQEILGMWYTAIAVLNWMMLFDFGIGGGMRNQLVIAFQMKDKNKIKEILSSSYFPVLLLVIIFIIFQSFVVTKVNWYSILGVSPLSINEETLFLMAHILVVGVLISFFSNLVSHIFYAMQKASMPGLLILVSNCIILFYLKFASPSGNENDIIMLSLVNVLANTLPAMIATYILFKRSLRGCFPSLRFINKKMMREILSTGTNLFYIQILVTLVFGVKELFISWFVGPDQVVDYQIYYKLIGMVAGLFSLALNPVWSAVTKAMVTKEYIWIKKLYNTGLKMISIFGTLQFIIVLLLPQLVELWIGKNIISVSYTNGVIFCIYNIIYMLVMLNYNFACGLGKTRLFTINLSIAVFLNVILSLWLCQIYPTWIMVIISTIISVIPCTILGTRSIFTLKKI